MLQLNAKRELTRRWNINLLVLHAQLVISVLKALQNIRMYHNFVLLVTNVLLALNMISSIHAVLVNTNLIQVKVNV
jgi:hypothetical protein